MLAAACAVGVGCCFAAPIGGRVPPARTSPLLGPRGEASRTLPLAPLAARRGTGTCPPRAPRGRLAWERQCC